jgi:hypothetical protein
MDHHERPKPQEVVFRHAPLAYKGTSIGVLSKLLTLNGSAILNLEVSIAVGAELVSCCICFVFRSREQIVGV